MTRSGRGHYNYDVFFFSNSFSDYTELSATSVNQVNTPLLEVSDVCLFICLFVCLLLAADGSLQCSIPSPLPSPTPPLTGRTADLHSWTASH